MCKQITGLAEALHRIHNLHIDEAEVNELSIHDRRQVHGRHGDVKPENILWFTNKDTNDLHGTLKISDLGSSDFHGPESKSVGVSAMGGFTTTYKAPEFDISSRVSPLYDIWSFGCVLMQFIIWYLDGAKGIIRFRDVRSAESNLRIPADDFFNFYSGENVLKTKAKACVKKVSFP